MSLMVVVLLCAVVGSALPNDGSNALKLAKESESANCYTNQQAGAVADFYNSVSFGQAVRWSGGLSGCTLAPLSLVFYAPASSTPNQGGITACVWLDDGFGRPGDILFSHYVLHDSIRYYPDRTYVHFPQCSDYVLPYGVIHTGFVPVVLGDVYAGLVDAATTVGASTSSIFIDGTWRDIGSVFGGFAPNWVQEITTCCSNGCPYVMTTWDDCNEYTEHSATPNARAMKVTIPETGPCGAWGPVSGFWLESIQVMLDSSQSAVQIGTGGIDIKVWSDSLGLPGVELASVHVSHDQCKFSPEYTTASFATRCDLNFRRLTSIQVGFEITAPETDQYPMVSDDGTHGNGSGSERILGAWIRNQDLYSPNDPNWKIIANIGAMKCGNAEVDAGMINISDAVHLINYIFGASTPQCHWYYLDADCNGFVSISDVVYLINYIFADGQAPCEACQ